MIVSAQGWPFDFGSAVALLKSGKRVCRAGWNGKGMWLVLVPAEDSVQLRDTPHTHGVRPLPWIGMKTADNGFVPWLASQTDILAEDWQTVA